jgi:hypothetical protein
MGVMKMFLKIKKIIYIFIISILYSICFLNLSFASVDSRNVITTEDQIFYEAYSPNQAVSIGSNYDAGADVRFTLARIGLANSSRLINITDSLMKNTGTYKYMVKQISLYTQSYNCNVTYIGNTGSAIQAISPYGDSFASFLRAGVIQTWEFKIISTYDTGGANSSPGITSIRLANTNASVSTECVVFVRMARIK